MENLINSMPHVNNSSAEVLATVETKQRFRHPFSFKGRIHRVEYLLTWGIHLLIVCPYIITTLLGLTFFAEKRLESIGFALMIALLILWIWFGSAQTAKRCHDIGISGWWQLVPLLSLIVLFIPGNNKGNKYE